MEQQNYNNRKDRVKHCGHKIMGVNFLHNHPRTERQAGLDENHVVVDRDDWEKIIRFFDENPQFIQYIK